MKKILPFVILILVGCACIYYFSKEKVFTAIVSPNVAVGVSDSVYKDLRWQKRCSILMVDEETGKEITGYFYPEIGFMGSDWLNCRVGKYINDPGNLGYGRKLRVQGTIDDAGQHIILMADPDYYKNNS